MTRLEAIKARLKAATPRMLVDEHQPEFEIKDSDGVLFRSTCLPWHLWHTREDAELLAHAPADLALLVEVVGELIGALGKVKEAIDAGECRADEDCDHCFINNELIGPALESAKEKLK